MKKREVLIAVLVFTMALLGCKKDNPIVGTWVVAKLGNLEMPQGDRYLPPHELVLKADGTFTEHLEVHVMMETVLDTTGTYKISGSKLILDGRATGTSDDGYRKEKQDFPVHRELDIKSNQLIEKLGTEETIYIRKGTKLASEPAKARELGESDEAKTIFSSVLKTYSSLKTYRDTGGHTCQGGGFMSKESRFSTRFERNGRFYFCTEAMSEGKPYQADAVWFDGKKSRIYMGLDGVFSEMDVRRALSTIEPGSGEEASLIPDLLMNRSRLAGMKAAAVLPNENLSGVLCKVIELQDKNETTRLWIDPKTNLIRKAHLGFTDTTILYKPAIGVRFTAKDFVFTLPSRR